MDKRVGEVVDIEDIKAGDSVTLSVVYIGQFGALSILLLNFEVLQEYRVVTQ